MSLQINLKVSNADTPILAERHRKLTDRTPLNRYITAAAEAGTHRHIRAAAPARHT